MKKNIDRRDFLKTAGSAALVMGGLGAVAGCKGSSASGMPEKAGNGTTEDGDMTYRTNRVNGDKVSILPFLVHISP